VPGTRLVVECVLAAVVGSFVTKLAVQTADQLIELDRAGPPRDAG